jgi:hypothetical protein
VISNPKKWIHFISKSYVGTAHDFSILKAEFDPSKAWFKRFKVRLDLGFQGFSDLYPCKELFIPFKKPRKQVLSDENKAQNKAQASERVVIEHSIGGLKRYRFLSDRLRARDVHFYDLTLGVCAALWNFSLKHPIEPSN